MDTIMKIVNWLYLSIIFDYRKIWRVEAESHIYACHMNKMANFDNSRWRTGHCYTVSPYPTLQESK